MERFFTHYQRKAHLPYAARSFLTRHGQVKPYDKGDFFMQPGDRMPYWCVVLAGLAFGYTLAAEGIRRIHWFAWPMQGFAGVRHLYTPRKSGHHIEFAEASTILRIPALKMREAKERFPEVSEILHIMKQQHIDDHNQLVEVLQQPTAYGRFSAFMESFPQIAHTVSAQHQVDFINVSRSQFFEARKEWLSSGS